MFYFIKYVFCWVFLFRAPCKHDYTPWHIIESSVVTYTDRTMRTKITVQRACRLCMASQEHSHQTADTQNQDYCMKLGIRLKAYVRDLYSIQNKQADNTVIPAKGDE